MKIELTIDGGRVEAELYDHPVARELAGILPLDLVFNDFNQVEKVAALGRSLTLKECRMRMLPNPGKLAITPRPRGWCSITAARAAGLGWCGWGASATTWTRCAHSRTARESTYR